MSALTTMDPNPLSSMCTNGTSAYVWLVVVGGKSSLKISKI